MIQLENVSVRCDQHKILSNITTYISQGDRLCILGPNGSGKTTLLKTIAGLKSYQGKVLLKDQEIASFERKKLAKHIGMLGQFSPLVFDYTVYELVMMGRYPYLQAQFWSKPTEKDHYKVQMALEEVEMAKLANQKVYELSGGEQQLVFLAKVIAQDPDILLLDEPNNHLDVKHQLLLLNVLKKWGKENHKTLISVFHDIRLALTFGEQVLLLKEGQIIAQGAISTALTKEILQEAFEVDMKSYFEKQEALWHKLK